MASGKKTKIDELVDRYLGDHRERESLPDGYLAGSPYTPARVSPSHGAETEGSGMIQGTKIADLLVVRQRTKRYELGDIAHIENVMMGESFSRTFRRREGTEITELTEAETTQTSERDLQSTSKHELKNEVEKTLKENINVEAGVDVSVTGPGVEVSANASFGYERSMEESIKTATNFAREVVDRSISRLQERTLERRTVLTTRSIEETSTHTLTGSPDAHTVGIYRWVDKIDEAQVVRYGKRELLEIIVPEPAAFYLYTMAHQVSPGGLGEEPDPPMVLDATTFDMRPLQVADISEENYLLWASKYNVTGITSPPPQVKYVTASFEVKRQIPPAASDGSTSSAPEPEKTTIAVLPVGNLKVDEGYYVTECVAVGSAEIAQEENADQYEGLVLHIGGSTRITQNRDRTFFNTWGGEGGVANLEGMIAVGVSGHHVPAAVVNIMMWTQRHDYWLDQWKLITFNAILARYNLLKADYEDNLSAASVQEGVQISGRNPIANREIERNELKKLAITMITGSHFDMFDAMRGPDPTHVYPQLSVDRAHVQGFAIKLMEQAFEWQYMSYVFHPYFWGRKERWVDLFNIEDVDPLFARFLRAGSARIQVPVRPGFKAAVDFLLANGFPLHGEPPHMTDGSNPLSGLPYIDTVAELQAQAGLDFETGLGTVSVTNGSTTVTGDETAFRDVDDGINIATTDREIKIAGRVYRVRSVQSPNQITLATTYEGPTESGLGYSLGPQLVGEPWEVRLPTTLVMLQGRESELNYPPL